MKRSPIWALIYKDSMIMRKHLFILLIIVVVFSASYDEGFGMALVLVFAATQPYTAALYDEQSHWEQLAHMLPYSFRQLVFSKYLFGYLSMLLGCVLSAAATFVAACLRKNQVEWQNIGLLLTVSIFWAALIMAIEMPMLFRLGVERGRRLFIALFALFGAAIGAATSILKINPAFLQKLLSSVPVTAVIVAGIFLTVFLQVYSVSLSTRFYKQYSFS